MFHTLFIAFADDPAHGHGGTHAQVLDAANWLPGVTALVVFGIAFAVLGTVVWPKITKALDDREKKIRDEIASAEAARKQAEAAQREYQDSLTKAREEANQMIAKARADAKAVADELRTRNEAELADMKTRATRDIEAAKQSAIGSLHAEASNLAVAIAGKILQREINPRDQQHLMDESIKELAKAGKN
jgi:F-type H+-transporting ATPase subunit b